MNEMNFFAYGKVTNKPLHERQLFYIFKRIREVHDMYKIYTGLDLIESTNYDHWLVISKNLGRECVENHFREKVLLFTDYCREHQLSF